MADAKQVEVGWAYISVKCFLGADSNEVRLQMPRLDFKVFVSAKTAVGRIESPLECWPTSRVLEFHRSGVHQVYFQYV